MRSDARRAAPVPRPLKWGGGGAFSHPSYLRFGQLTTISGRIESFRVRPDAAGLARLAALVHPGKRPGVELPDALVVSLGASALIVRDEATSLWQPEPQGQAAPTPDKPGGPTAA